MPTDAREGLSMLFGFRLSSCQVTCLNANLFTKQRPTSLRHVETRRFDGLDHRI
jgi:hypothetical protein